MKGVKIAGAIIGTVCALVLAAYFTTVSRMTLGQPRLLRIGHTRVLMETVPSRESGCWAQPIYATTAQGGVVKRVVAGHSVRIGRLNFFAVSR